MKLYEQARQTGSEAEIKLQNVQSCILTHSGLKKESLSLLQIFLQEEHQFLYSHCTPNNALHS